MDFSSVNWIAVIVASLAAFVVNFAWFGPLKMYTRWMRALKREPATPDEMPPTPVLFGATFASLLVEGTVIAALIAGLHDSAGASQGLATGLAVGIGLAAMPALGHRLFSAQGVKVWAIEVGADVIVAALMGLIIAAIG